MSTANVYPHLTFDADGSPRIERTRYKVIHLASEHYHHGWTAEELLRQHPDLRPEEVYSALTYLYDHYASLVQEMKASAAASDRGTAKQPFTRQELLTRRLTPGA